jgi:hypothetical protein
MLPNNSADSVPAVYLTFLDDTLNAPEDGYDWGQVILSFLYFNMSRADIFHSWTIACASDVVVDTIPDQEIEVNQYYLSQLKKTILCSYFIGGVGVELRNLH